MTSHSEDAWRAEDALDFQKRIRTLADKVRRLQEQEDTAKAQWKKWQEERKRAQAELQLAIEADLRPMPLFERPTKED